MPKAYESVPAAQIVRDAFAPVRKEIEGKKDKELVEGWARVIQHYGHMSMYRYLTEVAELDERTIDLIGTVENLTSRLHLAFVHSFIGASLISPDTAFFELPGGTATLADALYARVKDLVRLDRRATRITHGEGKVTVDTVSEGRGGSPVQRETFTADTAIITVPFSGLRHIPVTPALSYGKRRAVTELHYDAATKVLLEFSRRWWEFDEADWKRELEAVKPGLYRRYQLAQTPEAGGCWAPTPPCPRATSPMPSAPTTPPAARSPATSPKRPASSAEARRPTIPTASCSSRPTRSKAAPHGWSSRPTAGRTTP